MPIARANRTEKTKELLSKIQALEEGKQQDETEIGRQSTRIAELQQTVAAEYAPCFVNPWQIERRRPGNCWNRSVSSMRENIRSRPKWSSRRPI